MRASCARNSLAEGGGIFRRLLSTGRCPAARTVGSSFMLTPGNQGWDFRYVDYCMLLPPKAGWQRYYCMLLPPKVGWQRY
jgi:hypothetical protein